MQYVNKIKSVEDPLRWLPFSAIVPANSNILGLGAMALAIIKRFS